MPQLKQRLMQKPISGAPLTSALAAVFAMFVAFSGSALADATSIQIIDGENNPLAGAFVFQLITPDAEAKEETKEIIEQRDKEPASHAHIMDQVQRQFSPQLLVVQPGDTVSFPNSDNMRHHVYSFSDARAFEFQLYATGTAPSVDFPNLGLVTVGCNIHDDMIGHIIVSNNPVIYETDDHGMVTITDDEHGDLADWYVWHPWFGPQGFGPLELAAHVQAAEQVTLPVVKPAPARESELEQRFRRRLQREH